MRRMGPQSAAIVSGALALATSHVALAQARLSTQLSSTVVQVGERFQVQVTYQQVDDERPSSPELVVPSSFEAQGPSLSTQQSVSIVGLQMTRTSSTVATWILAATAKGHFRIGPASMVVGGRKVTDRAVDIDVVAASNRTNNARGRRRNLPFDPFDPFGGGDPFSGPMFPPIPGLRLEEPTEPPTLPAVPEELNVERAKDPLAFLDARVTPKRAVVGEQIRLNVYAYFKPGASEAVALSEPTLDGFLSYRSEHDDLLTKNYVVAIAGERYLARKFLSYALFPTKSGPLTIGPTVMTFATQSRFAGGGGNSTERRSEPLTILVEEPPLSGRPPFYHLGDVGQFKLTATVEPRQIHVGESVSVQIEVSGTGQLPQRLDAPEQSGLDWLEPSVTQQVSEQRGMIGGARQFAYVVRMSRAGNIDLGQMRFAFFNPATRKYEIARADLGQVLVQAADPSASTSPGTAASGSVAPGARSTPEEEAHRLVAEQLRTTLSKTQPPSTRLVDRTGFVAALGMGPVAAALFFLGRGATRRAREIARSRSSSAMAVIRRELTIAEQSLLASDRTKVLASLERALHLVIEDRTGLKSRGILRDELLPQLQQKGLDAERAKELVAHLGECEDARFTGALADGDPAQLSALVEAVKRTVSRTLEMQRRSPSIPLASVPPRSAR